MHYVPISATRRSRYQSRLAVRLLPRRYIVSFIFANLIMQFGPVAPQAARQFMASAFHGAALLIIAFFLYRLASWLIAPLYTRLKQITIAFYRVLLAGEQTAAVGDFATNVIDTPRLRKPFLRLVEFLFSLSIWVTFISLIQPLATVLMWLIGFKLIDAELFDLAAVESTVEMMKLSVWWAGIVFLILFGWAQWNYWRYGRLERRKHRPAVTPVDLAVHYQTSLAAVHQAQTVKAAIVEVEDGQPRFSQIALKVGRRAGAIAVLALMLALPDQALAKTAAITLQQIGYEQDITVTGAKTAVTFSFPAPRLNLLPGSMASLTVEPGPFLNDQSNFTIYINDRAAAFYSAGQLRKKPAIQLPLTQDMLQSGSLRVAIAANLFATNDLCADYERGHLFYIIRNQSGVIYNYNPVIPKTVPEFFAGLTSGLLVVIPDQPTLAEITAGSWAYAQLQKQYPYLPVKLILAGERGNYPEVPRVWVALHNNLPANLTGYTQGIHLPFADLVLITAQDEGNLYNLSRQLGRTDWLQAANSANISVSLPAAAAAKERDKVFFGNNGPQEGILSIPVDFTLYPALLAEAPRSITIHLEGRYSPANISGKQVRLDVYFNRALIHSEALDGSGKINKEISLPPSVPLKSKNALSIQFVYPEEAGYCQVKGTIRSAQIFQSSYFAGNARLPVDKLTWDNIGMLFNKKGAILISDNPSPDAIRAVGELVLYLNRQLPPGEYAYPLVAFLKDWQQWLKQDYLAVLGLAEAIPEELWQAFPLQRGKGYTLLNNEGQAVTYRYHPVVNTIVGQIGNWQGCPLLSITASSDASALAGAIRKLNEQQNLASNIFLVGGASQLLPFKIADAQPADESDAAWTGFLRTFWERIARLGQKYEQAVFWAAGILLVLMLIKHYLTSRR
ncbi:hypothetical protein TcarDRAFT_2622 [Thermosinus carboxydivorans Nor1]|uniref:Uncharacterized protein n=1 Tax=Thermosinus carboxydivorans Nor1 TaxID=401526 RepID=A1HM86_9FIRM|nr:poly-beta-1,6-N-acetyl-D-glucosamine biosynthesis protein PgaD [Thermosinus carboxydivorans]EAX48933.1 hypothetical protein TcarDRAFT_2622 [Thermosinus carboxydivorans Nor1]